MRERPSTSPVTTRRKGRREMLMVDFSAGSGITVKSIGGTSMRFRCFALLAAVLLSPAAWAQDYPTKPVQVIIAYAAGGGVDVMGRAFMEAMTPLLGQQF